LPPSPSPPYPLYILIPFLSSREQDTSLYLVPRGNEGSQACSLPVPGDSGTTVDGFVRGPRRMREGERERKEGRGKREEGGGRGNGGGRRQ
jgi:hypothetical protein